MALFSKRHYSALAQVLRKEIELAELDQHLGKEPPDYHAGTLDALDNIRQALADFFQLDNPAFNPDRWLKASK